MKKNGSHAIEAEAACAAETYKGRAELNRRAREILPTGSRQITIRLSDNEIAVARHRPKPKG